MGELLLCNESIAAMPFYLEGVSINVYSIEELDYYIMNNTFLLDKSFMSRELCAWIENQAKLPKLAGNLRMIISTNGRLSAFVDEILRNTGYCSASERKQIHDTLSDLEEKSTFECSKLRADRLMENEKYLSSIFEYNKLLASEEAKTADSVVCGNIYNNLATAYARLFLFETAAGLYKKAYTLNKNRKSLWSCLYAYKCMDDDTHFKKIVNEYGVSDDEITSLENVLNGFYSADADSKTDEQLKQLNDLQANDKAAYSEKISDIILRYKEDYRSHVF
ncbi:hypothetical protein [Agathobacter sp.]